MDNKELNTIKLIESNCHEIDLLIKENKKRHIEIESFTNTNDEMLYIDPVDTLLKEADEITDKEEKAALLHAAAILKRLKSEKNKKINSYINERDIDYERVNWLIDTQKKLVKTLSDKSIKKFKYYSFSFKNFPNNVPKHDLEDFKNMIKSLDTNYLEENKRILFYINLSDNKNDSKKEFLKKLKDIKVESQRDLFKSIINKYIQSSYMDFNKYDIFKLSSFE